MTMLMRARAYLREVVEGVRRERIQTGAIAVVAALCVGAILLSFGGAVASTQSIVRSLESPASRLITIDSGIDGQLLDVATVPLAQGFSDVEWAVGLGPAVDGRNSLIPGGAPVAVFPVTGDLYDAFGIDADAGTGPICYVGADAAATVGISGRAGSLELSGGLQCAVVGVFQTPTWDSSLGTVALLVQPDLTELKSVVMSTTTAGSAEELVPAFQESLSQSVSGNFSITSSLERLVESRRLIEEVREQGTRVVLASLTAGFILSAVVTASLLSLRKMEFGRRRALGSSRAELFWLIQLQILIPAALGVAGAVSVGFYALSSASDAQLDLRWFASLAIVGSIVPMAGASVPLLVACFRDPLQVLRKP